MIRKIPTLNMSRADWLAERRKGIGGSDAAGIIGLSRWSSAYSVWADKTGRIPDKPDTEAMREGRDLEEYVARRWQEATGKQVRRCNAILYNTDYPFALANIDRAVVGEKAGLECKTTSSLDVKKFHGVEFPEQYYVQCVHYLAVTGWDRWYLAVLVLGREFHTYVLERDEDEISALMAEEAAFWLHVESDTPPAPDGSAATADTLSAVYRESSGTEAAIIGREGLLREYLDLKEQKKALDDRAREIENIIKDDMQNAETGVCGAYRVLWKTQTRSSFQTKDFQKAYPGIDLDPFFKVTTARPFKITENRQ